MKGDMINEAREENLQENIINREHRKRRNNTDIWIFHFIRYICIHMWSCQISAQSLLWL